jgi:copper resistance protein B
MKSITRALCLAVVVGIPVAHAAEPDPHAGHDMSTMEHSANEAPAESPPLDPSMNDHMDDDPLSYMVLFDNLEIRDADSTSPFAWDVEAWIGRDVNRLYLRSEGEIADGDSDEVTAELLWARPVARWWNLAAGVREDFEPGDSRTWLAMGVFGLAPYRLHMEATAYIGDAGRSAFRLKTDYDVLLTNRLILQPRLELDAYGEDDPSRGIGSGISSIDVGLRLRYEFRREFAPYLGVVWVNRLGQTGDLAEASGEDANEVQALAGLRMWF